MLWLYLELEVDAYIQADHCYVSEAAIYVPGAKLLPALTSIFVRCRCDKILILCGRLY